MTAHWHVTLVCDEVSIPPVVVETDVEAILEFHKMIDFVENVTGLQMIQIDDEEKKATFFGESTVRRWPCSKDCPLPRK